MTESRGARLRLALVDVSLGDCDHLARLFGDRLELVLVIVPAEDTLVGRWAEVGGYPCTAELRRLSAVVADAVAVGGSSPRREEALALATLVDARAVVLAPDRTAGPGSAADAVRPLDEALEELFGTTGRAEP